MPGRIPDITNPAVEGRMEAAEALRRLLTGTGLQAVRLSPTAYRLEAIKPAAAAPAPKRFLPPRLPFDEIVVTGAKRAQSLAILPFSATVLSVDGDRSLPAQVSTADIAARAVGLTLTNLGPGRNRQFIRGVADSPFNGASQSTVSIYLDDARVTFDAPDPDLRLVDVERVEILKGPQGPLYGTGALGGIYHIVSVKPALSEIEASTRLFALAQQHGSLGEGVEGMVNAPVIEDTLALRAVGYQSHEPGWIDTLGGRKNINDSHVTGGRLALRWQPAAEWTVDIGGALQLIDVDDSQYVLGDGKTLARASILPEPHDNDFRAVYGTLSGPIGGLKFQSITSWVKHEVQNTLDASAAAASFDLSGPLLYADERAHRIFNQELRLSNNAAASLSWVAGLSFLSASSHADEALTPAVGNRVSLNAIHQRAREWAAFGEASLPLFDDVRLTAGARLFRSETEDARIEGMTSDLVETSKTAVVPSLSLSWQPDLDSFYYIHAAGALRPGGIAPAGGDEIGRFKDDELWSVDAGTRLNLADGHLSFVGSAYLTFWQHLQSDYLLDNGIISTHNVGDGVIYGLEGSVHWTPHAAWAVDAGFTIQHARLENAAADTFGENTDRRLPAIPDYNFHATLQRGFEVRDWTGAVEVRTTYIGPSRLSFDPDLDRHMGNYAVVGLMAYVSHGPWTFNAGIDNLFDARSDTFAFGNPFSIRETSQYTPLRPRTLTVGITKTW